jgi:hypothetical protein
MHRSIRQPFLTEQLNMQVLHAWHGMALTERNARHKLGTTRYVCRINRSVAYRMIITSVDNTTLFYTIVTRLLGSAIDFFYWK